MVNDHRQDVNSDSEGRVSHDSAYCSPPPLFRPFTGGITAASSPLDGPHPLASLANEPLASTGSFMTESSGSTVPGIGMYSGRVVNRVGQAIINVAEEFKIRKRLRQINRVFTAKEEDQRISFYRNIVELSSALDDLNELSGRPNRSIALSKTGYPQRIVREALATLHNVIGLGAQYTKYDMSHEERLLLVLRIADSFWILADRSSIIWALSWMLDLVSVHGSPRKDRNSGHSDLSQSTFRAVSQAVCDTMAAAPASLADFTILHSLNSFFRTYPAIKQALLSLNVHLECIRPFIRAILKLSRKSSDPSILASVYDLASTLWFEQNSTKSELSEEDKAHLDDYERNTEPLHSYLYSFDRKALGTFDVDGPHAAKEAMGVLKYQLYRNSLFPRKRRPYVQHETMCFLSQLVKKKKQALLHYNAPHVLWSCLTDIETEDWLKDVDDRCKVICEIAGIMSSLDQKCLIYDRIANAWLRKKRSLDKHNVAISPLSLCCFAVCVLSRTNKRFGEIYLRGPELIAYLSGKLCKPQILDSGDQKLINTAFIALLNYSWTPMLTMQHNVPDFLVRQISFKADNTSSIEALQEWSAADLDLLQQLYLRGGCDMQAIIRTTYDACKHNQHTMTRMKLFRTIMKSVFADENSLQGPFLDASTNSIASIIPTRFGPDAESGGHSEI